EAGSWSSFVAGALVAHPPILLTEVGGAQSERVRATADAMRQLDGILSTVDAPLAIVVSPHSPSSMTSLPVRRAARASGDLGRFRAPQVRVDAQVDVALAAALVVDGQRAGFALTWAEEAGECGLRPLAILLGAGRAANLNSQVLSYEGPFGVGYPVVAFTAAAGPAIVLDVQALGRHAIDTYLRTRQLIDPPEPIPIELQSPSAVFVTLRKDGELRGCVGSLRPTEATAAHELIRYAVASAVRDPRFDPVRLDEVSGLAIKVQLLDMPEPVADITELDPKVYGIIVRRGDRQALLLPDIDGIETPEQQVLAACQKAGIDRYAPLKLERFRTRTLT